MKSIHALIIMLSLLGHFAMAQQIKLGGQDIPTAKELGDQVFCEYTFKRNQIIHDLNRIFLIPTEQWTKDDKKIYAEYVYPEINSTYHDLSEQFKVRFKKMSDQCKK